MPARFYSLDVLRGIAALCVVVWHWQAFFYDGSAPAVTFAREDMPLFAVISLLYKKGYLAVDLFFCLSGFIFHWLYSDAIAKRSVSGRDFFILRFSRLYPLHLVTLLAVAAEQILYHAMVGVDFAHQHNTARNFAFHLVFANGLIPYSFNAPAWSISIEVMLYVTFFCLYRLVPVRAVVTLVMAVIGFYVAARFNALGRGLVGFFMGGAAFLLYRYLLDRGWAPRATHIVAGLAAVLWLATVVYVYIGPSSTGASLWASAVLFPLTILGLALLETRRGTLGKRLSMLGDISYSSYLWHFPLQLLVMIAVMWAGIGRDVFYSPVALLSFFAVLIAVSYASYRYFERPMQDVIRRIGIGTARR